ncbi:MAG: carbohydrate kinase family protein [Caldisericia bacterium]|nr:carbohydrate kinase family protein [Caldisericia bacterium]
MDKCVIVLGDNCIDFRVKIKKETFSFKNDENRHVKDFKIVPAGTGVNFSISLSKLGLKTYYISSISKDFFGNLIYSSLNKANVNLKYIKFSKKETAKIIIVLNEKGERISFADLKNASYDDTDFEDVNLNEFENLSALYISGGLLTEKNLNKRVISFLEKAKQKTKIFFDLNYRIGKGIKFFKEASFKILEKSDFIFTNEFELSIIKKDMLDKFLNDGKIFILKMGDKGAKILMKEKEIYEEAVKVKSIDTTGAGDIFNASFIYSYILNFNLEEALKFANVVAALSTTKFGLYIPEKEKIEKYLKERRKYA